MAFSDTCNEQLNTPLNAMGFLYMTMGAADGQIDESEVVEMINTLGEWPTVTLDDIGSTMEAASNVMSATDSPEDIATALDHCCMVIKNNMSDEGRGAVLADLARIANADGEISDNEGEYWTIVKSSLEG